MSCSAKAALIFIIPLILRLVKVVRPDADGNNLALLDAG
jgi:hypothetical protein